MIDPEKNSLGQPNEHNDIPERPSTSGTGIQTKEDQILEFEFKGNSKEYFKIWIVNLVLTILTLGIYSAWAKVRTRQYFYGNTYLNGSSFRYTANAIGILKGRLIAAVFVGLYSVSVKFFPEFIVFVIVPFIILLPWLVVKSMRFNARYTKWCNISFNFTGTYKEAAKYWLIMYILVPFTLGLIIPHIQFLQKKFVVERLNYGQSPFKYRGTSSDFYSIYLAMIGIGFLGIIGIVVSMVPLALIEMGPLVTMGIAYLFIVPFYLYLFTFQRISIFNAVANSMTLENNSLISTQKAWDVFKIYLTNILAIIFSLGLLVPWAMIRLTKYRMENLSLRVNGDLESFMSSQEQFESAIGEEVGEAFDFDFAF